MASPEKALIVGTGPGLSSSLARLFTEEGMAVAVAARNSEKLSTLASEIDGTAYQCDASDPSSVNNLFAEVTSSMGEPDIVVYNASNRGGRGPVTELNTEEVRQAILISCYGGFLIAQAAAKQMTARRSGTILLTGASASYKGYPNSSSFAMGKFGLRGLAQSLARELAPQNIHVAHFCIDGGISQRPQTSGNSDQTDDTLEPDAIAETYLHIHRQHRSAWTWEVELRPWAENF